MTLIEASQKANEKLDYQNRRDDREKPRPTFVLGDFVETAVIKRNFSKGDSTNWSYNIYTKTEVLHDTIPSYNLNYKPERCNENLLLPTKLTVDNKVTRELNLTQ